MNRFSRVSAENIYKKDTVTDVKFDLQDPSCAIGEDIVVKLTVTNESKETRAMHGRLSLLGTFYTGVPGKRVTGKRFELELAPEEG